MADVDLAEKRGAVSSIQMFFFSITERVDGFAGRFGRQPAGGTFLTDLEFRAESATDVFAIDHDL
jgi:hypothetical protein